MLGRASIFAYRELLAQKQYAKKLMKYGITLFRLTVSPPVTLELFTIHRKPGIWAEITVCLTLVCLVCHEVAIREILISLTGYSKKTEVPKTEVVFSL